MLTFTRLLVSTTAVICLYLQSACQATMTTGCGSVFITVSSLQGSFIELNWKTDCTNEIQPNVIALYDRDIRNRKKYVAPLIAIKAGDYPGGYYLTKIKFSYSSLPGSWDESSTDTPRSGPQSFPYWIVSFSSDDIIDIRSLATQPTWMSDNSEKLGPKSIGALVIPGTHDSGCFPAVSLLFEDYILTQDQNIWAQLVFGIRYFDLRVASYDEFYINHDIIRITKIVPVFRQIKKFLQLAPKEVIFVDFHRFPYPSKWDDSLHAKFIQLVKVELGDLAYERNELYDQKGPTLNQIWSENKNIIISYANVKFSNMFPWLWPPIPQAWADTTDVVSLRQFLEDAMRNNSNKGVMFDALMTELTPTPMDILFNKNGLRKLASAVNSNVTKWVRDVWKQKCNVIASDYFLGNNIINVAIDINTNR